MSPPVKILRLAPATAAQVGRMPDVRVSPETWPTDEPISMLPKLPSTNTPVALRVLQPLGMQPAAPPTNGLLQLLPVLWGGGAIEAQLARDGAPLEANDALSLRCQAPKSLVTEIKVLQATISAAPFL